MIWLLFLKVKRNNYATHDIFCDLPFLTEKTLDDIIQTQFISYTVSESLVRGCNFVSLPRGGDFLFLDFHFYA